MVNQLIEAWCFIFNNHPHGDKIMGQVMDPEIRITEGQFRVWFNEAQGG
jgi:hypothetical protein